MPSVTGRVTRRGVNHGKYRLEIPVSMPSVTGRVTRPPQYKGILGQLKLVVSMPSVTGRVTRRRKGFALKLKTETFQCPQ